jgi:hypothetical protein
MHANVVKNHCWKQPRRWVRCSHALPYIGQPQFISIHDAPAACAAAAAFTPSAMLLVATCTPKQASLLALYSRAFSTLSPLQSSIFKKLVFKR